MNREWNSKRRDSLLHSSVPALPGSTNPTGCYDMTWCVKRSVSYLSVDSWNNPVQVLHPNSRAERNTSINNTPPRPRHMSCYSQLHPCVCVYSMWAHWNSVYTHIYTQSPMLTQKSAIKLSQGFSPIANPIYCLLAHIQLTISCDLYFSLTYFQLK